jgi:hypothetical protein
MFRTRRDDVSHYDTELVMLLCMILTLPHDVLNLNGRGTNHPERRQVLERGTGWATAWPILDTARRKPFRVRGGRGTQGQGRSQTGDQEGVSEHCAFVPRSRTSVVSVPDRQ